MEEDERGCKRKRGLKHGEEETRRGFVVHKILYMSVSVGLCLSLSVSVPLSLYVSVSLCLSVSHPLLYLSTLFTDWSLRNYDKYFQTDFSCIKENWNLFVSVLCPCRGAYYSANHNVRSLLAQGFTGEYTHTPGQSLSVANTAHTHEDQIKLKVEGP